MKKLFYIFTCFTLLCSCSAEKRLAYLLAHHPELHRDTTYVVDTFLVHPADTASTTFTIEDLQQLLQQDTAALGSDSTPVYANPAHSLSKASASIRVENNGRITSIIPNRFPGKIPNRFPGETPNRFPNGQGTHRLSLYDTKDCTSALGWR